MEIEIREVRISAGEFDQLARGRYVAFIEELKMGPPTPERRIVDRFDYDLWLVQGAAIGGGGGGRVVGGVRFNEFQLADNPIADFYDFTDHLAAVAGTHTRISVGSMLYIDPACRSVRGLADRLMRYGMARAAAAGYTYVVGAMSPGAEGLMRRCGGIEVGPRGRLDAKNADYVPMGCDLRPFLLEEEKSACST